MERIEEISEEALKRYPEEPLGTKAMINGTARSRFEEGAQWADSVPSFDTIDKVIKLRNEWIKFMLDNEAYVSAHEWIRKNW